MTEWVLALSAFVLSWTPAKGALQAGAYGGALVIVGLCLALGRWRPSAAGWIGMGGLVSILFLGFLFQADEFRVLNFALGGLTYGAVLLVFVRWNNPVKVYYSLVHWMAISSVFETLLAAGQILKETPSLAAIDGGVGDYAVGTLLTHSHLFVAKMWIQCFVLVVAFAFKMRSVWVRLGILFSALGALLGSALFISVLFAVGVGLLLYFLPLNSFFQIPSKWLRRMRLHGAIAVALFFSLLLYTQPKNAEYVRHTVSSLGRAIQGEESLSKGKILAGVESLRLMMDEDAVALFGTGLGHFSSRAAMILTGGYLTSHPEWIPVSMSSYTKELIYPLWNPDVWTKRYRDGVLNQPFHAIQSLGVELGLVGFGWIAILVGVAGASLLRARYVNPREKAIQFTAVGLLILVPVLGLSDNWLEYPSFTIPIWMLVSLAISLHRRKHSYGHS